jgi:hypothetical protein
MHDAILAGRIDAIGPSTTPQKNRSGLRVNRKSLFVSPTITMMEPAGKYSKGFSVPNRGTLTSRSLRFNAEISRSLDMNYFCPEELINCNGIHGGRDDEERRFRRCYLATAVLNDQQKHPG